MAEDAVVKAQGKESYTALYRKFRPLVFDDVKGQEAIVTTLKNQLKASRVGHAYLFCGTRGTGKTTVAKILAKAVNCENLQDGNPCGVCENCRRIASGANLNVVEIDAASNNGVDNIREIVSEVEYVPAEGKYRVYIIDEVHMLSAGAFNALLKTLEEPPSYVIFILATTEAHKIPITILSRCQRYDFRRISIDTIAERMRELIGIEKVAVEEKALRYIARSADGSMRDALSLLDQCIAFHFGEELTYEKALDVLGAVDTEVFSGLLRAVFKGDVTGCMETLHAVILQGRELTQFVSDFIWYLRNLLLAITAEGAELEDIVDMSAERLARLREEAAMTDVNAAIRYIRIFSTLSDQIRYAAQKRILIEVALIKLCRPETQRDDVSLLERIRRLEERVENGVAATVANTPREADEEARSGGILPEKQAAGKERPKLPDALPEELKRLGQEWDIVPSLFKGPVSNMLRKAMPSVDEERTKLVLGFDREEVASGILKDEAHVREIEEGLSAYVGKEIHVEIRAKKSAEEFRESHPDLLQVKKALGIEGMEIEEE